MRWTLLFLLFSTPLKEEQWLQILGEERFRVMREKGTEKAYLGEYVNCSQKGIYVCAACTNPLFDSRDKLFLGSGWPLFSKPIHKKSVYYLRDDQLKFKRYEVLCRSCDSHLGHILKENERVFIYNQFCCLGEKRLIDKYP